MKLRSAGISLRATASQYELLIQGVFTLSQCLDNKREVQEPKEEHIKFLKSRRDLAESFESAEEPLDLVALFIQCAVVGPRLHTRLDLGGTTGIMPKSNTSWRVSSPS